MKKLIVVGLAGVLGLGVTTTAHAGDEDGFPEIPDSCVVVLDPTGPARVAHAPAGGEVVEEPNCDTLDVCILFPILGDDDEVGPSRRPHVVPEECGDVAAECVIDLNVSGPARGVHPRNVVDPTPTPTITPEPPLGPSVDIPQECQGVLAASLAGTPPPQVPTVGSDNTPMILMASALVLTGGLLILGQRRLARR